MEYFVRIRGRASGPYCLEEIRAMIRRGALVRIHEMSADGENWSPAGAFDGLFVSTPAVPMPATRPLPSVGSAAAEASPEAPTLEPLVVDEPPAPAVAGRAPLPVRPPDRQPPTGAVEEGYCYSRNGAVFGPVPLRQLQNLAATGVLQAAEPVWKGGDDAIMPAGQLDVLKPIYDAAVQAAPPAVQVWQARPVPAGDSRTGKLALAAGLSAAGLLLFCVNIPHEKTDGRLVWWWDLMRQSGLGIVLLLCLYGLLAGLGLVVAALLLKGRTRGWVYVGAAWVGLPLLVSAGMSVTGGNMVFLALFGPVFYVGLACVAHVRAGARQAQSADTLQAVGASLVCLMAIAFAVLTTLALLRLTPAGESTPGWLIFGIAVSIVAHACGLAGGVSGFIGVFAGPSRKMAFVVVGGGAAATVLIVLAGAVVGYGAANLLPSAPAEGRFAFVRALRLLVATGTLVVLCATGVTELLTSAFASPGKRQGSLEPLYQEPIE